MPSKLEKILILSSITFIAAVVILIMFVDFLGNFSQGNFSLLAGLEKSIGNKFSNNSQLAQEYSYSFDQDLDNDGLSDAKEIIYGTDPYNPDTSQDGMKDGEKVQKGLDPLISGKQSLEKRAQTNLSIAYFLWLSQKTGDKDPRLDSFEIEEFLAENTESAVALPQISLGEINLVSKKDQNAIEEYITKTSEIKISPSSSYLETASQVFQNNYQSLQETIEKLERTYQSFKNIETPVEAVEIQKKYLAALQLLQQIFTDLYKAKEDPVKVMCNAKRGEGLIQIIQDLEKQKIELLNNI